MTSATSSSFVVPSSKHDEYTDYSCSTQIERLARDIETLLRSWHVDKGSDRHVTARSSRTENKRNKTHSSGLLQRRSRSSSSISQEHPSQPQQGNRSIRSDAIEWNLNYHSNGSRISLTVPLELALWDGLPTSRTRHYRHRGDNTSTTVPSTTELLPFAIQRQNSPLLDTVEDWWESFSTIFGIGQHISLSLRPDASSQLSELDRDILTTWLQTALNIAASYSQCYVPIFALWGIYQPQQKYSNDTSFWPSWMTRRPQRSTKSRPLTLLAGQLRAHGCVTSFSCQSLDETQEWKEPIWKKSSNWTTWGMVLQRQTKQNVHLWAARHWYAWNKEVVDVSTLSEATMSRRKQLATVTQWRQHEPSMVEQEQNELYRFHCQRIALSLLENAAGATKVDPLWGPVDDPTHSLKVVTTWGAHESQSPLLSLPLESQHQTLDEDDKAETMERNILNPLQASSCRVVVHFDPDAARASLGATQRCVLAALIRAATLPREMLLYHLTDENVITQWDSETGNHLASMLATRASVDETTHALVAAMDWPHAVENMIEGWQAAEIVQKVLDPQIALEYPVLPGGGSTSGKQLEDWTILRKSAAPGRLLALLFVRMASVRSPPSMALVWKTFVEELRRRVECSESLPNMSRVDGLDPVKDDQSFVKQCFSTVGSKSNLVGHINASEPDPDDMHCLVGQKLQALNVCIESMLQKRAREASRGSSPQRERKNSSGSIYSSPLKEGPRSLLKKLGIKRKTAHAVSPAKSVDSSRDDSFYDDAEDESFHDATTGFEDDTPRRGARCPVQGATLFRSSDQLYAPYLQRPEPLTDDMITQRQFVLAQQQGSKASSTSLKRLEIAQRLQKPKLLSDMQAFKAANPGAVFQDFIGWYGNPDNPLAGFEMIHFPDGHLADATTASTNMKLDRAAEAIRVLDKTRQFWSQTWDEARAIPAEDQDPLFDASGSAEMIIDHLGTIHPATLLCQVMAVNLAMAYFTLVVSARDAVKVPVISSSLMRCRDAVVNALDLLSYDVNYSEQQPADAEDSMKMLVSVETLYSCGRTCLSLSESEILVSRAKSLLQKIPLQYKLVNTMISQPNGSAIEVTEHETRAAIIEALSGEDERKSTPIAATREYVWRDDDNSRLTARYTSSPSENAGSNILVGITKTQIL